MCRRGIHDYVLYFYGHGHRNPVCAVRIYAAVSVITHNIQYVLCIHNPITQMSTAIHTTSHTKTYTDPRNAHKNTHTVPAVPTPSSSTSTPHDTATTLRTRMHKHKAPIKRTILRMHTAGLARNRKSAERDTRPQRPALPAQRTSRPPDAPTRPNDTSPPADTTNARPSPRETRASLWLCKISLSVWSSSKMLSACQPAETRPEQGG